MTEENSQPSRFEVIVGRAEAVAAFGWKAARVVWVCVQLALLLAIAVMLVWVVQLVIEVVEMIRAIPDAVRDMMPSMDGFWPFVDDPPVEDGEKMPSSPDQDGDREDKPLLDLDRLWPFRGNEE